MQEIRMQGYACMQDKGPEKLLGQGCIKSPYPAVGNGYVVMQKRPVGDIDYNPHQRLIHREAALTIPGYPLEIPQSLFKGLAQAYSRIFNRMVIIDLNIAFPFKREIEKSMNAKKCQHMIKKGDIRVNRCLSGAIKAEYQPDIGFQCYSLGAASSSLLFAHILSLVFLLSAASPCFHRQELFIVLYLRKTISIFSPILGKKGRNRKLKRIFH